MNEIQDLLYDLAVGIVDLFHENAKLKVENKQLREYKEKREKQDYEYFKQSQKTIGETIKIMLEKGQQKEN